MILHAQTLTEARAQLERAGFRFDELRSFDATQDRPGYAFSLEGDRACYGHPMAEVRIERAS